MDKTIYNTKTKHLRKLQILNSEEHEELRRKRDQMVMNGIWGEIYALLMRRMRENNKEFKKIDDEIYRRRKRNEN